MSRKSEDLHIFLGTSPLRNPTASNNNTPVEIYRRGVAALESEILNLRSDEPTVNGLELKSLQALIAYIAYDKAIDEAVIRAHVEERFTTNSIEKISQADFEEAIAFLVNLNPRTLVN
ncbi:MAG: hypothetical protein PHD48_11840 [Alphaproteobacteria bacterium]|nr:hypothetical protein [Alphaproteobacteria bacterium]